MEFSYSDMKCLVEMLTPKEDSDTDEDDLPQCGMAKMGPGDIQKRHKIPKKGDGDKEPTTKEPEETSEKDDDIWDLKEVSCNESFDQSTDPRCRPTYDIKYRQAISTEDVFLQMGGRTPSSFSCEDMVLTVNLPGERRDKVDLNVKSTSIDLRSPMYRLILCLPHPVDPNSSRAQWDEDTQNLTVILRMNREFDFVNF